MPIDSSILDMSDALIDWEREHLIKNVVRTTADFEPVETVTGRNQLCVVQAAEKEKLNPETIDWSKEYLMIHSRTAIEIDELVYYSDEDYIVIEKLPQRGYGFFEVIACQTKKPVVPVS